MIINILKFLSDPPPPNSDITIVDFFGQTTVAKLAGELHSEGYDVSYSYCPAISSLHPDDLSDMQDRGLQVHEVQTVRPPLNRTTPMPRWDQIRYGLALSRRISSGTVISCGLPALSDRILRVATQYRNGRYIGWLQGNKPMPEDWLSLSRSEQSQIRLADHLICASDQLLHQVRSLGRSGSVSVLPGWGPVGDIEVGVQDNDWATEQGLDYERYRVVYAGELGANNRCGDISRTVKELLIYNRFEFIFAGAGEGYEELRYDLALSNCPEVHFVGQPDGKELSQVLASADILLASFDPSFTELTVSETVLSYLCAGRPILALAERNSPSAQLIRRAGAGRIVSAAEQLGDAIFRILKEPDEALLEAKRGRQFAERHFDPEFVAPQFIAAARLSKLRRSKPAVSQTST